VIDDAQAPERRVEARPCRSELARERGLRFLQGLIRELRSLLQGRACKWAAAGQLTRNTKNPCPM
jgi:hypothetical protein